MSEEKTQEMFSDGTIMIEWVSKKGVMYFGQTLLLSFFYYCCNRLEWMLIVQLFGCRYWPGEWSISG